MNLDNYSPTFRNVLLKEVVEAQTKGGIYIPSTGHLTPDKKLFKVLKTGKDCIEVKVDDYVKLTTGIRVDEIDGHIQVMEQQIIGYYRPDKNDSVRNASGDRPKTSGSS